MGNKNPTGTLILLDLLTSDQYELGWSQIFMPQSAGLYPCAVSVWVIISSYSPQGRHLRFSDIIFMCGDSCRDFFPAVQLQ